MPEWITAAHNEETKMTLTVVVAIGRQQCQQNVLSRFNFNTLCDAFNYFWRCISSNLSRFNFDRSFFIARWMWTEQNGALVKLRSLTHTRSIRTACLADCNYNEFSVNYLNLIFVFAVYFLISSLNFHRTSDGVRARVDLCCPFRFIFCVHATLPILPYSPTLVGVYRLSV